MPFEATPFIPHSYQELLDRRAFDPPLPEAFYEGLIKDYEALDGVDVSRITYKSNGLNITGLMALPAHIHPGTHPVLIYNRGGFGDYGMLTALSVMRSMVPFAEAGYLVFASNYRGNDGGQGQDGFGADDVDDVLNLLELARMHKGFDGQNAFMLGHSRGGMMTYLAIKRDAPIRAAISIAGIADVRPRGQKNRFERLIAADATGQAMQERSALCWPEALDVPMLLLHGSGDTVIEPWHSQELATALGYEGTQVELQIYEGGNHALVRHWDGVLERCHEWLERQHA